MKEHDDATILRPETKPAHDEGGKKAHGVMLGESINLTGKRVGALQSQGKEWTYP